MLKDIAPKGRSRAVKSARRLRREMSLPEVILWQALRKQPNGMKFRRQHPSGPYILDFFCSDARLAIEIDGEAHNRGDRPQRDEARDAWLRTAGVRTLRIAAADVLSDADAVVRWVFTEAEARLPLHHPALPDGPPPRDKLGED
ncbi:MAG: endonuclease domain-containing protein [Sphingomicrobium sp.]